MAEREPVIGIRQMDDPRWPREQRQAYLAAKREQERRYPDGRLLDYGPTFLLIDEPSWFAPQYVGRE